MSVLQPSGTTTLVSRCVAVGGDVAGSKPCGRGVLMRAAAAAQLYLARTQG